MDTALHILAFYALLALPFLLLVFRPMWPAQDAKLAEKPTQGSLSRVDAVAVVLVVAAGGLTLLFLTHLPGIFQLWEIAVALFWYLVLRRRFPLGRLDWQGVRQWLPLWLVYVCLALCVGLLGMGNTNSITFFGVLQPFLLTGPGEELIFRGIVQTSLTNTFPRLLGKRRFPVRLGTLLAALVFGLFHLINLLGVRSWWGIAEVALLEVPATFVLGLAIGHYYDRTGKLWGAIVLHGMYDTLILITRPVWPF
jgi:membrane protease YdiL (CAAX protease family)